MCGIFGIIARNTSVPEGVLERATKSLAHRGPDDSGMVTLRDSTHEVLEIGFGNRRLAILDLSPLGHQPMNDPVTGNWIVYNGEIYNFREIRAKLELAGVQFSSGSDTEVILRAYSHWGEKCLLEFRGMFALAIWDAQRHSLFVARDPMGIKPLYYYQSDRYFLFSSEIRTLLGTGLVPRSMDPAGLINYLTFGSVYDPHTLIEGIASLPAGCLLRWKQGQIHQEEYWDLVDSQIERDTRSDSNRNHDDSEAKLADKLDEAVRLQLVSDVPVGVFLSGGIDSSSLVGILTRMGARPSTFSIVFSEAEYSEAPYSREIARQFRTDHHELTVSQSDFFRAVEPAIHAMDLPTIDGINTYFVSEQASAAGVKVALSGLGGDEVFAGYSNFRTVPRMEKVVHALQRMPRTIRRPLSGIAAALVPSSDKRRKLQSLVPGGHRTLHPYFLARMLFTPQQQTGLIPDIQSRAAAILRAEEVLSESLQRCLQLDPINRVSYLEARCYLRNTLLRDSDSMSMAHGLEVRVPLIDHQLAHSVLSLPGSRKLNGDTPKHLLVRALHGQLPDAIIRRPKQGFTLPFEHWLRGEMRPVVEKSLRRIGDGALGAAISSSATAGVWKDFLERRTSWSRPWSLYVLQRWCERHLSNN